MEHGSCTILPCSIRELKLSSQMIMIMRILSSSSIRIYLRCEKKEREEAVNASNVMYNGTSNNNSPQVPFIEQETNRHLIRTNDDESLANTCLTSLEEVDYIEQVYLVYSVDVECCGEIVIDGAALKTGSVEDRTRK